MILQKVIIKNFKNLGPNFILAIPKVMNYEFMAKNAFGKTSIADAIFWVMTGKLLNGSSDIMSIKPKDNPSALVSVELLFDNGTSIMKTYQENWVKTRGTTEMKLEGHTTNCFINGINIPCTKFDESIRELFKIDYKGKWNGNIFQLLIDPLYFGMKEDWQNRRKLVIDLVGDVTDEDVLAKEKKLEPLRKYLLQSNGKFEDVKKILANNLKKLNDEEKKLNAQIEILTIEQTVTQKEFDEATVRISSIEQEIQTLSNQKYQVQKDLIAERKVQIGELKSKLSELKEIDNKNYQKSIEAQQQELQAIREEKSKIQADLSNLEREIAALEREKSDVIFEQKQLQRQIEANESQMQSLRNKWAQVNASVFETNDSLICPNCGHDLHGDQVEKKRKEFNERKVAELENITNQGKSLKETNTKFQEQILDLKQKENDLAEKISDLSKGIPQLRDTIQDITNKENSIAIPKMTYSEETISLENQIKELEAAPYPVVENEQEINTRIGALQFEKNQLQVIRDKFNAEQMNIRKAEQLTTELATCMEQIATFESLQDLLTQFIKTKLELLNERVESVFGDIKFQLVESNIKEGSWNEVCWVLDGEVPYHNTNSAAKIRLGVRVCEAIRKRLGISGLFYLIDNAEQITDRDFSKLTKDQTISFVALDVEPKINDEHEQVDLFSVGGEE